MKKAAAGSSKTDLQIRSEEEDSCDIMTSDAYAVQPDWSINIEYKNSTGAVYRSLVPCRVGMPIQLLGNGTTFLQFENNTTGTAMDCKVVTLIPKELDIDFQNFSGVAIIHSTADLKATTLRISHDSILESGSLDFSSLVSESGIEIRSPGPFEWIYRRLGAVLCSNSWQERADNWLRYFFGGDWLGDLFKGGGGGRSEESGYDFTNNGWGSGFSWGDYNFGAGDGGSTGSSGGGGGGGYYGNNGSRTINVPDEWKNEDWNLVGYFGLKTGAYDFVYNLKKQARDNPTSLENYNRLMNFYINLLIIAPDLNENLSMDQIICPHGGCEPINVFEYARRVAGAFPCQVVTHFIGNTNLTSMALYSWAWNMDSGIAIQRILEYINAHPELWGAFTSVNYTLPQITDPTVHSNIMSKFNKLKFLDEQCALNYPTIRSLLTQDNYGDLIGMTYNFYFQNGESLEARDFIKYYLNNFVPGVTDQFSQYILYWNSVPSFLSGTLGLDPNSADYLSNLSWLRRNIGEYNKITEFYNENAQDASVKTYILQMVKMLRSDAEYVTNRFIDLWTLLKHNPHALLQSCVEQNTGYPLSFWSGLYNFTPDQSTLNELSSRGFSYQPLTSGNAATTSVDYYYLEIDQMPDFDGNGSPDSEQEVIDAIRANFANLASGNVQNFAFDCPFAPQNPDNIWWNFQPYDPFYDGIKWTEPAPNYKNSVFFIDAGADNSGNNNYADKGAIIISQASNCCWIGSTIQTPLSGSQPFSGNRQWGIQTLSNGKKAIYTKAADRARTEYWLPYIGGLQPWAWNCDDDTYYNVAYETWKNLMVKIGTFIRNHGGQVPGTGSNIQFNVAKTRVDNDLIKQKLKSNTPVSFLSCE